MPKSDCTVRAATITKPLPLEQLPQQLPQQDQRLLQHTAIRAPWTLSSLAVAGLHMIRLAIAVLVNSLVRPLLNPTLAEPGNYHRGHSAITSVAFTESLHIVSYADHQPVFMKLSNWH